MNTPDDLDLDALPAGDQLKLARLQKVQRETELLESKLAERRRELVRLDDVEKLWENAIIAIRNTILGFGTIREDDRHALLLEIADCHSVAAANAFGQDAPPTTTRAPPALAKASGRITSLQNPPHTASTPTA